MPRTTAAWLVIPPCAVRIPAACMPWISWLVSTAPEWFALVRCCFRIVGAEVTETDAAPGEAGAPWLSHHGPRPDRALDAAADPAPPLDPADRFRLLIRPSFSISTAIQCRPVVRLPERLQHELSFWTVNSMSCMSRSASRFPGYRPVAGRPPAWSLPSLAGASLGLPCGGRQLLRRVDAGDDTRLGPTRYRHRTRFARRGPV